MIIPRRSQENKKDRPKIQPEMGPFDWILEMLAILMLLGYFGFLIYYYPQLPDAIPSHFNGAGEVDEYAATNTLWVLPGIALFIYLLLTIIARFPHTFNFTQKITPQNALRQYTLALRLIRFLKIMVTGIFISISCAMVLVATSQASGFGVWFIPVILAFTFVPVIAYLILASRKN